MMKKNLLSRRTFIERSIMCAGGLALTSSPMMAIDDVTKNWNSKAKSSFTMWQIPSHKNTIGNSYVFRTNKGKVVVMDGGYKEEANFLRGFLAMLGGEVEAWFISHPHDDHMEALNEILKDPQDIKIKAIYHSRIGDNIIDLEKPYNDYCRDFYAQLDKNTVPVTDIQQTGVEMTIDGMHIKVLGIANPELTMNPYNNNSMILRVWDKKKSLVFLGDAGIECGNKVLNSQYRDDLNCEYLQVAHHGQRGCDEHFYKTIKFRACLWPTPLWVWNNDIGNGFNTCTLKTIETRNWMDEIGIKEHHVSCVEGLFKLD
jgi:beta-lactamase superfamily II metal-dependent hydrolase